MSRSSLIAVAAIVVVTGWSSPASAAAPRPVVSVDVQKNQVVASELTPGTQALVYGYGAVTTGYDRSFVEWHEIITDDDHDGRITYTPAQAIPWRSMWVVVDLRNAHFGVGAPAGYQIATPPKPRAFKKSASGLLDEITTVAPWISGVYVHPGGGVWLVSASDGMGEDADGKRDGLTSVTLPAFTALTPAGDRPKEFTPGGVLIVVDPFHMRLDSVQLDGSVLNNGGGQ